jgi:RimJ/RimL family protein N-acetyltransferase
MGQGAGRALRGRHLVTDRLLLRRWEDEDRPPFAALNADPQVMALFPAPLRRSESDALVDHAEEVFDRYGFGPWAVEERTSGVLAGLVGILPVNEALPFAPAMEIGWRLARPFWGRGYATEAARAALADAFSRQLDEVVSFTFVGNHRSRAVMVRLGMRQDDHADFEHPNLPPGHRLRHHVVYRLAAEERPPGPGTS